MPVYVLMNEMPYDELVNWSHYFRARPIGWRDDNRTYMLLSAQGVKEKPERLFPSLKALNQYEQENTDEQQRVAASLKSSGLLGKLQQAASNNKVEWKLDDT